MKKFLSRLITFMIYLAATAVLGLLAAFFITRDMAIWKLTGFFTGLLAVGIFVSAIRIMFYFDEADMKVCIHDWNGCKCAICGKTRNDGHEWNGCKCVICGKTRNEGHEWDHCICKTCGKPSGQPHVWNGCKCTVCGAERHEWVEINREQKGGTCCWDSNSPCTGPNCGTYCDSFKEPGYYLVTEKCKLCDETRERREEAK